MLPCSELTTALDFYTTELGFRVNLIYPADAPRIIELSGHGLDIRLERDDASFIAAPRAKGNEWGTGRAGMQYRDLIPDLEEGGNKMTTNESGAAGDQNPHR